MSTGQTQNIPGDVLEEALNNLNNAFFNGFVVEGSGKPDIYSVKMVNTIMYWPLNHPKFICRKSLVLMKSYQIETDHKVPQTKDGFPYIIWIEMSYDETSNNQNNNK